MHQENYIINFKISQFTFLSMISSTVLMVQLSCCSLRAEGVNDGTSGKEQVFAEYSVKKVQNSFLFVAFVLQLSLN